MLARRIASIKNSKGGFTLIESIVSLLIVAIVLAAIAGALMFGSRMLAAQRTISNAGTLASTIKTSLESTLRYSTNISTNNNAVTFTTTSNSNYLGNSGSTYTITSENGKLTISDGERSGDFLPEDTFIDNDAAVCTFTKNENGNVDITITVNSAQGGKLAETTASIATITSNT